jgi:predicted choloylglycine hydrolase
MKSLQFTLLNERYPDKHFRDIFNKNWPAYRAWYLDEGESARPSYLDCIQAFKHHMPELYPVYRDIIKLLDADDLQARFLSLYCPPPFFSGCSQLALVSPTPVLIRNYDFPPILCVWGALDGMNASGLAVSIAYGGRLIKGVGFGITIVIRYVLETCATVDEAIAVFKRIPVHLDYNIALVDADGQRATLYIAPDRELRVTHDPASTNHQDPIALGEKLFLADSGVRLDALNQLVATQSTSLTDDFLTVPLYRPHCLYDSGTLYTAAYYPQTGQVTYLWPHAQLSLTVTDGPDQVEPIITIIYDG